MIDKYYKEFKVKDYMDNELNMPKGKDVIDCSLGTNPFITEEKIKEYIKTSKSYINEYHSNEYATLKEAILNRYASILDKSISVKNIAFGSGTMGIIRGLCEFLVTPGTKVLGVAPQFTRFISEVELKRGEYVYYSLDKNNNYKFNVDEFLKLLDKDIDVVYIDNPNNPTGQIIQIEDIEKVIIKAKKVDAIVLIDEAYGDYIEDKDSSISLVHKYNNLVVFRSASKFYGMPNHRVGYMFANEEIVRIYNEVNIPFPFSDLSANIFVNALKDYDSLSNSKRLVKEAKEKIIASIGESSILSTSTNTPIFTLKTDKDINLTNELISRGIITESGLNFINLDKNYSRIRINKEVDKLIEKIII